MSTTDDKLWTDPAAAAAMLGEAVGSAPFRMLIGMLQQYEERMLAEGIDDPDLSKDYLRGFVHAIRTMRSDMEAARSTVEQQAAKDEWEAHKRTERSRVDAYPGHGPGGLS